MMIDCTLKDVATSIQTGPFGSHLQIIQRKELLLLCHKILWMGKFRN